MPSEMKLRTTSVPIYVINILSRPIYFYPLSVKQVWKVSPWSGLFDKRTYAIRRHTRFAIRRSHLIIPSETYLQPRPCDVEQRSSVGRLGGAQPITGQPGSRAAGQCDPWLTLPTNRRGHQCKTSSRLRISKYGLWGSYFGHPSLRAPGPGWSRST